MKVERATAPSFGVDTVAALTLAQCRALRARGFEFVVRYLGGVSPGELGFILDAGLAFMPVTYSRKPGWVPSAALGEHDGETSLTRLRELAIPIGVTAWLDLEGCAGPASATADWVNAWATKLVGGGYEPGLYVGAEPGGLDALALWKLKVVRYWRSCSRVPEPANRGFCMLQLRPPNVALVGTRFDFDAIEPDWKGAVPAWVRA